VAHLQVPFGNLQELQLQASRAAPRVKTETNETKMTTRRGTWSLLEAFGGMRQNKLVERGIRLLLQKAKTRVKIKRCV
jgi:hypothetical protein